MSSAFSLRAEPARGNNPLSFSAVPHELILDKRLIATDVRLVGLLLVYARDKVGCWPSVPTLAKAMGVCVRTIQYSIKRLVAAGWVKTENADNPTGRVFTLVWRCTPRCKPQTSPPVQRGGDDPNGGEKKKDFSPMTAEEKRDWLNPLLEFPIGHPLRMIAERRL